MIAAMVADMSSRARANRALHANALRRVGEALDDARSQGSPDADDLAFYIASAAINPEDLAMLCEIPVVFPQTADRRTYKCPTTEGVATFRVVRDADDYAVGLEDTDGAPIELPDFVWGFVQALFPSQAEWEVGRKWLAKQGITGAQLDEWREQTDAEQAATLAKHERPLKDG